MKPEENIKLIKSQLLRQFNYDPDKLIEGLIVKIASLEMAIELYWPEPVSLVIQLERIRKESFLRGVPITELNELTEGKLGGAK